MSQLVVLNLGNGNWQQGFPAVTAQLWQADAGVPMQFTGTLPPAPELDSLYTQWQRLYEALYADQSWRRAAAAPQPYSSPRCNRRHGVRNGNDIRRDADDHRLPVTLSGIDSLPNVVDLDIDEFDIDEFDIDEFDIDEFDIDEADVTHISQAELDFYATQLQQQFNAWLNSPSFQPIDRKLRTQLVPSDEIRLVVTAESDRVLQLPWVLWSFFDDFPQAELALSPTNYGRISKAAAPIGRSKVKILAILGDSQGIDIAQDQALLAQLPNAEVQFLVEPTRAQLSQQLWASGWDILFFAGHSSTDRSSIRSSDRAGQPLENLQNPIQGQIQINATESLTIEQLKYGLRQAINQGLKLAIFNSCDGLGLARGLADLQIPQVIVMREPLPDRVAHVFLTQFLAAFAGGKSLYLAVREAREKLQDLEADCPGAAWLPVICQNPAEVPQSWGDWCKPPPQRPQRAEWRQLLTCSALATGFVLGIRALGLLQPAELWAYDQLVRWRPVLAADRRILVVTITEADIQAQGNEPRKGSLSDRTLSRLLTKLEQSQAAGIGLDLYRDFPVEASRPELAQLMSQSQRLMAICKRPDPVNDPAGILPPPEVGADRLGFSDFVEDHDGVLRRQLLRMSANPASGCTPQQSFAAQLAFRYLQSQNVTAGFTPTGDLQLGGRVYPRLNDRSAGYQAVDAGGSQLLLNYRAAPRQIAEQVSVGQILSGQISANAIRNRIVMIGVASNSSGDYWATPYGRGFADRVPGVFLQAQMVSQLLSAGLDRRPLLTVWPQWAEALGIGAGALSGGLLMLYWPRRWQSAKLLSASLQSASLRAAPRILAGIGLLGGCTVGALILLINGVWIPVTSVLLACGLTQGSMAYRGRFPPR